MLHNTRNSLAMILQKLEGYSGVSYFKITWEINHRENTGFKVDIAMHIWAQSITE